MIVTTIQTAAAVAPMAMIFLEKRAVSIITNKTVVDVKKIQVYF